MTKGEDWYGVLQTMWPAPSSSYSRGVGIPVTSWKEAFWRVLCALGSADKLSKGLSSRSSCPAQAKSSVGSRQCPQIVNTGSPLDDACSFELEADPVQLGAGRSGQLLPSRFICVSAGWMAPGFGLSAIATS